MATRSILPALSAAFSNPNAGTPTAAARNAGCENANAAATGATRVKTRGLGVLKNIGIVLLVGLLTYGMLPPVDYAVWTSAGTETGFVSQLLKQPVRTAP
jgi:hypothetical protein